MSWISVDTSMPDFGDPVLVVHDGTMKTLNPAYPKIGIGILSNATIDYWQVTCSGYSYYGCRLGSEDLDGKITHWQALPALP